MPRIARYGAPFGLWCAQRERSGGFDSRSPGPSRKTLQGHLCFTHLLPRCFSVSHLLDTVSRFPTLSFFCLSLSPSFCLAVILALAICFLVRHTRRRREVGTWCYRDEKWGRKMPCEHPWIFEEPLELCSGTAFTENCILKSKLEILNIKLFQTNM